MVYQELVWFHNTLLETLKFLEFLLLLLTDSLLSNYLHPLQLYSVLCNNLFIYYPSSLAHSVSFHLFPNCIFLSDKSKHNIMNVTWYASILLRTYNGAQWCYVNPRYTNCRDLTASSRFRGKFWSYQACATPGLDEYPCYNYRYGDDTPFVRTAGGAAAAKPANSDIWLLDLS